MISDLRESTSDTAAYAHPPAFSARVLTVTGLATISGGTMSAGTPTLAQQLMLYRLLFEEGLGLMCIHDLDGVLLAVNPAVGRSLGYPAGEGVGRNLRDFLVPAVCPLFDQYLERIRTEGTHSGLMRLLAKDG